MTRNGDTGEQWPACAGRVSVSVPAVPDAGASVPPVSGPAPAPHLAVEAVTLRRDDQVVLRAATAGFARGRVTAVVGPSGAGKTSLLRCCNRLEEPQAGRVLIDGVDIRTLDPRDLRRRVGMVFQTPLLFPGDVLANLAYGLADPDRGRLEAALARAGLPSAFFGRDSDRLSVGEAQRVTIARALARDPEVLLMDEPTSALDVDATAGIEALTGELVAAGLTVVLVTHDLDQARRTAHAAVLLVAGRVVASGPVAEVAAAWPRAVGR